jgi:hypothetical protein
MTVVLETRLARFKVFENIFQSRQDKKHTVCIARQGKEKKGKQARAMRKQDKVTVVIHLART